MHVRVINLLFFPLGFVLLALFVFQEGNVLSPAQIANSATPDRLAEPTLPVQPSQADYGAQVYWLSCLPCHGDKGQGLTDEFRMTYPPEDQNCWASGCHGERPYENGFKIPKTIPALIGQNTLLKFSNAAYLHSYILSAMPFWKPGSLSEEDAWRVTAFLLRENRYLSNELELNASNADKIILAHTTPIPTEMSSEFNTIGSATGLFGLGVLILIALLFTLKKSQNKAKI